MEQQTETPTVNTEVQSQPPVDTAQKVETKEDPQSQESFSKRFAALNRERKALSQKEIEIKKLQAQIESEKSELQKWKEQQEEVKKSMNPLKALEMHGFKYEDAAQFILNDEKPTSDLQIKSVQQQVEELKRQLEEKDRLAMEHEKKLLEKTEQEQNTQAINAVKTHLESKPEFDALVALGMHDDIFAKINSHYKETGEVLKIDEVATEMMQKVEEMLGVVTKTNIYKTKFAQKQDEKKPSTPPKTLSNQLSAQTPQGEKKKPKTDEERIKNALALLSK